MTVTKSKSRNRSLSQALIANFGENDRRQTKVLLLDDVAEHLEGFPVEPGSQTTMIRGYKVTVVWRTLSEQESTQKRRQIEQLLANALMREKQSEQATA